MFDTLYSVYRNQQKARQQAGLNQPFSTGLPEGVPNGNIPTQEQYNQRIAASANYANPVPMLPPEVGSIMNQGVYGSFGPSSITAPPINPDYQPVVEEAIIEAPQTLPNKEEVIGTVDTLAQQLRPSDNPSGASIHDEALKQINSILNSNDPQSKWQEQQDKPFWQRNDAYAGLIGVGLSLLSGASPIEAFQAGEGMRTTQARKDELANNKAYLLDRYSADSVAQALASGDASLLKEKGMSQKDQFALQQAQGDLEYARRKDFAQFQNDLKGEDPGSWTSGGNGIIFNTRSGAVMNIGGQGTASVDAEAGQLKPYMDEDGLVYVPSMNKGRQTGEFQFANAAQTKSFKEAQAGQKPSAQDEQISGIVSRIEKAPNSELSPFTGYATQFLPDSARESIAKASSGDTNSLYKDVTNFKQTMTNKAVALASEAGQSGINIQAEVDRLAAALDRIDYSSPEALKRSIKETEELYSGLSKTYQLKKQNTPERKGALASPTSVNGWSATVVN